MINLFVMRDPGFTFPHPELEAVQGFNTLRWADHGLNLLAVSDLNREELTEFATRFEAATEGARVK